MAKAKPETEETTAPTATKATVYAHNGGLVRTYTLDVHGEQFADLAKEMSDHTPGSRVELG